MVIYENNLFKICASFLLSSPLQDLTKVTDTRKECDESTNLIPQLEGDLPRLQQILIDEEKILDEIKENSKGDYFSRKIVYIATVIVGFDFTHLSSGVFLFFSIS